MKRREYLTAVAAGTAVCTAGCFWEDDDSNTRLGRVSVQNYYERPQRFVVHVEANGRDAMTTEIELDAGGVDPTTAELECGWSEGPGTFAVHVHQLTEPTDTVEVSVPDEYPREEDAGYCVGVDFLAGFRDAVYVVPRAFPCEDYPSDVEFCVPYPR